MRQQQNWVRRPGRAHDAETPGNVLRGEGFVPAVGVSDQAIEEVIFVVVGSSQPAGGYALPIGGGINQPGVETVLPTMDDLANIQEFTGNGPIGASDYLGVDRAVCSLLRPMGQMSPVVSSRVVYNSDGRIASIPEVTLNFGSLDTGTEATSSQGAGEI